jgi:hypothetical protein
VFDGGAEPAFGAVTPLTNHRLASQQIIGVLAGPAWPLTGHGVACNRVLLLACPMNRHNWRYLRTRADRFGPYVISLGPAYYPRYREQT